MKSFVSTIIISVAAACLAGCGSDVVNSYSDFHTLPDWGWRYTDVEEFTVTSRLGSNRRAYGGPPPPR